jgi:predicted nuclease of predicted toxin-antitoxin system
MRLLADENFPKPIVEALRAGGHDLLWARTDLGGASDVVLLDLAESEARIVLMLDKDFWHAETSRARRCLARRSGPLTSSTVVAATHPSFDGRLGGTTFPLVSSEPR